VRAVGAFHIIGHTANGRLVDRRALCALAASAVLLAFGGCGGGGAAPPEPDAKDRLEKLYNLYRAYAEKNNKPPPSEQALRDFAAKLTPEERSARLIGDDLEGIFTSPRDNEKFVIKYNVRPEPAVNRAVAWESKGENGMRWVALTMGYVVEYDEQQLKEYTK
jgi:hypothetical protein